MRGWVNVRVCRHVRWNKTKHDLRMKKLAREKTEGQPSAVATTTAHLLCETLRVCIANALHWSRELLNKWRTSSGNGRYTGVLFGKQCNSRDAIDLLRMQFYLKHHDGHWPATRFGENSKSVAPKRGMCHMKYHWGFDPLKREDTARTVIKTEHRQKQMKRLSAANRSECEIGASLDQSSSTIAVCERYPQLKGTTHSD